MTKLGSQKLHICPKVTKMGSIIGHRIDYNGVGALTGSPPREKNLRKCIILYMILLFWWKICATGWQSYKVYCTKNIRSSNCQYNQKSATMLKSPKKGRKKKAVHGCVGWKGFALGNNLKSLSQHQKFFLTISNPVQIFPTLVHCNTVYQGPRRGRGWGGFSPPTFLQE